MSQEYPYQQHVPPHQMYYDQGSRLFPSHGIISSCLVHHHEGAYQSGTPAHSFHPVSVVPIHGRHSASGNNSPAHVSSHPFHRLPPPALSMQNHGSPQCGQHLAKQAHQKQHQAHFMSPKPVYMVQFVNYTIRFTVRKNHLFNSRFSSRTV
jgi:hypothetical protein